MRTRPPDRRATWRQKARISGQKFFVDFGEYDDGRLCEIFVEAAKEGAFVRGILGALARMVSMSLQCGATPQEVCKALRYCTFEPNGDVTGSPAVKTCTSLVDWIAQEIEAAYCVPDTLKMEKNT